MIRIFKLRYGARIAVAAAVASLLALPAMADVVVLAGKGNTPPAGTILKDDSPLELAAGATLNVLLPSGVMKSLSGPLKTTGREIARGDKAEPGLWDKVTGIVQGGSSEKSTGAVRSALPSRGVGRAVVAFSWTEVPLEAEGDYCIDRNASLSLVRPAGGKAMRMTIVDLASNTRGEVNFAANEQRAPWPTSIQTKTGKYALVVPDRGMKQVQLRVIDPVPPRETAIRVLHGQGCEIQMQALLRELMTSSASLPGSKIQ